jgi:endonuclease-3 related protein
VERGALAALVNQKLMEMHDRLLNHFGPQNWWPAQNHFEVMVGAVLTQNTNWKNVEKAIDQLKKDDLLSLASLHAVPQSELAKRIRPAGYFNIKAKRLKNLIKFIYEVYEGDLERLLSDDTSCLRDGLLSVNGIGPETADSILLYAAQRPVFVIDAYTHRILARHHMCDEETDYYALQDLFVSHLPEDVLLFNEFHALMVRTAKEFCKNKALCEKCPLKDW